MIWWWRRRSGRGGLGALLLDAVTAEARRAGCHRLTLDTGVGQPAGPAVLLSLRNVARFSPFRHAIGLTDGNHPIHFLQSTWAWLA